MPKHRKLFKMPVRKPHLWIFQCNVLTHWEKRCPRDQTWVWLKIFLIKINKWLKNPVKSRHDSMIPIKHWFHWPFLDFHSMSSIFGGFSFDFIDFLGGLLLNFVDPLGIRLSAMIRISSWLNQLSRNWLRKQLMTRVDSSGIDSDWPMTQNALLIFDSNQLMTKAKSIWFSVDSRFNPEPYPCLQGTTIQERLFTLLEIDCPGNTVRENISAAYQGVVHHLMGREVEKLCLSPDSNQGPPTSQAMMLPLSHQELALCWLKLGLSYKGMEAMSKNANWWM